MSHDEELRKSIKAMFLHEIKHTEGRYEISLWDNGDITVGFPDASKTSAKLKTSVDAALLDTDSVEKFEVIVRELFPLTQDIYIHSKDYGFNIPI